MPRVNWLQYQNKPALFTVLIFSDGFDSMITAMTLVNSEVAITLQYLTFRDQFLSLLHTSSCSAGILTVARSVHAPHRMDFKPHSLTS